MTRGIKKTLHKVKEQMRYQLLLTYAVRGLGVGTVLSLALFVLSKFVAMNFDVIRMAATLLVTGLSAGMIWALMSRITTFDAAFACDTQLGLKERITSALEFAARPDSNPLVPALIADADRYACKVRPSRDFPLRFPREMIWCLAILAVTIGLYFVPPWQYVMASEEKKAEFNDVQAQAKRIREVAKEIKLDAPPERADEAQEIAKDLQQLAKDMEFGTLTRAQALERLSAIEDKINKSQDKSGYNDLKNRIDQMKRDIGNNEDLSKVADALKSGDPDKAKQGLEDLAKKLEEGKIASKDYQSLAKALDKASKSMSGNPQTQELSDNLAKASQELSAAAQQDPAAMASALIEAIDRALPEIDQMTVPQIVKDKAKAALEAVKADLQKKLDSGTVTQADIDQAKQKIKEVKDMLQKAGANLENKQTPDEVARELKKEADELSQKASGMNDIDSAVRSQAMNDLKALSQNLDQQISNKTATEQSNAQARQELDQIKKALEDARSPEDVARELRQEAEDLKGTCSNNSQLSSDKKSQCMSTLQSVADKLGSEIAQGATSKESNEEAKQQLEKIKQQLNNQNNSQTSDSQSGKQGSQSSSSSSQCKGSNDLFGMCQNPGSSGQAGQQGQQGQQGQKPGSSSSSKCSGAASALRKAGQACNKAGSCMKSGNGMCKVSNGLGACRSGLCKGGNNGNPKNGGQTGNGGNAASGWGVGTTPYEAGPSNVVNQHKIENREDPNGTETPNADYQSIYNPNIDQHQGYDTKVSGKEGEQGGSIMYTQVIDPQTGETSYVPYFNLEPTDVQSLMDSVENQEIPRSYQDLVRFYFDRLTGGKAPKE